MYLALLTCFLLAASPGVYANDLCGMTPTTFQEDFNTSCSALVNTEDTCNRAWVALRGAFAGVDPQDVEASNYESYFNVLPVDALRDQSLFWSRTSSLVEILSMMNAMVNVVSSANSIPSEAINNIPIEGQLNWCGIAGGGIDFESNCLCSVTAKFWTQFSQEFAEVATGNAFYLTDGEDASGAYRNDSFFATVELPNMNDDSVTQLVVLVVHRQGEGESCGETSGTIQNLRNVVGDRFDFDCYDIYGQASDSSQSETIASCLAAIIGDIQEGTEGSERQIECNSGVTGKVSLLLMLSVHILYWLI